MKKLSACWLFSCSLVWATPDWRREVNAQVCGQPEEVLLQRLGAQDKEVFDVIYFDTQKLALNERSLNLRLRLKTKKAEVTLKWRAQSLPEVPRGAECEIDVYRGRSFESCSWEQEISQEAALRIIKGELSIHSVLNTSQSETLRRLAPDVDAPLRSFGPIQVNRWKVAGASSNEKWRLESWLLPNNFLLLSEVSFRDQHRRSYSELQTSLDQYLQGRSVQRCKVDGPKTTMVLRHFQKSP